MKYIRKVILENFQSHKYSELEFDNHLNVIVGPSDQGKSAIIRAIKWALFNEPSGDFFIKEGEKDCTVTIIFNDNSKLKRYRSKSKNLYFLYDANNNETVFEGFGTNVPQEIIDATNIRKIYLDGKQSNAINISDQLEGPFLLSEKTVVRASAIGRLVGVHIVDDAVGGTLKDIRNLNVSKRNLEEQLNILNKSLEEYEYLDELKKTVEKIEIRKNKIRELKERVNKLNDMKIKLKNLIYEIKETQTIINKLKRLDNVEFIFKQLSEEIKAYIFINSKLNALLDINKDICYNENIVQSLQYLDRTNEYIKELEFKVNRKIKLNNFNKKYSIVNKNLKYNRKILNQLKDIDTIKYIVFNIDNNEKKLSSLKQYKFKMDEVNKRIAYGNTYLNKLLQVDTADKNIVTIEKNNFLLSKLVNIKNKKSDISSELNITVDLINKNKIEMENFLNQYKKLLLKFEVCPLCLNKIDDKTIEKIVNTYK